MIYHKRYLLDYNSNQCLPIYMFENFQYLITIGFGAYNIHDKTIKPCIYKQVKLALVSR